MCSGMYRAHPLRRRLGTRAGHPRRGAPAESQCQMRAPRGGAADAVATACVAIGTCGVCAQGRQGPARSNCEKKKKKQSKNNNKKKKMKRNKNKKKSHRSLRARAGHPAVSSRRAGGFPLPDARPEEAPPTPGERRRSRPAGDRPEIGRTVTFAELGPVLEDGLADDLADDPPAVEEGRSVTFGSIAHLSASGTELVASFSSAAASEAPAALQGAPAPTPHPRVRAEGPPHVSW